MSLIIKINDYYCRIKVWKENHVYFTQHSNFILIKFKKKTYIFIEQININFK